jgi:amino acid transporter
MMGSDRILAVAAYDGAFPGYFGRFHPRLGTPVRVNVMSGIVSTIFMLAAVQLLSGSASAANTFTVVLYLATSTTLLSYLLIFPAGIKLRLSHGHLHRPYRLGATGNGLMWLCAGVTTAWMLLGSWVAVFPGTLEVLTGHSYSVMDSYGVTRLRFEVFTLGTLAIVVAVGVIGYVLAADVRAKVVDIPLEAGVEPAAGD